MLKQKLTEQTENSTHSENLTLNIVVSNYFGLACVCDVFIFFLPRNVGSVSDFHCEATFLTPQSCKFVCTTISPLFFPFIISHNKRARTKLLNKIVQKFHILQITFQFLLGMWFPLHILYSLPPLAFRNLLIKLKIRPLFCDKMRKSFQPSKMNGTLKCIYIINGTWPSRQSVNWQSSHGSLQ